MDKLTVRDVSLKGKRVLMRVDFNVPLSKDGKVTDDTRIQKALPTIQYIVEQGASLILMSHLGRPKGKVVPEMSLKPVADHLKKMMGKEIGFAENCIGEDTKKQVEKLNPGDILLLENLRFYKEETDNDSVFANELAQMGDIYVNDAFGTSHRAHASTVGVTDHFDKCVAGLLMEKEISYLAKAIESPERPFIAILGGAKISGKIDVIQNLLPKVDSLLIGGGMAFAFFKAMGYEIGKSILEEDKIDLSRQIISDAEKGNQEFLLPKDIVCVDDIENPSQITTVSSSQMKPDMIGVDIGKETLQLYADKLKSANTVVWNGPMGIFETPEFAKGTFEIAKLLAERSSSGTTSIVGGGDSVAAVRQAGLEDSITHISTGGGASLELLSGYQLPGLDALTEKGA